MTPNPSLQGTLRIKPRKAPELERWASHVAESIYVRVTDPSANGAEHGQSHRTPARS